MKKLILSLLVLLFISMAAVAQKVHFDNEKWVEYIEGNIPLVISVPHGGRLSPDHLPIRNCTGAIKIADMFTIELAKEIQSFFMDNYGVSPHIVIAHLARKHVDQNRELNRGGTCGYEPLNATWNAFHNYVDSAINLAGQNKQKVMYVDLHGHAHQKQRLELGYNIDIEDLVAIKNGDKSMSSKFNGFHHIVNDKKQFTLSNLLFGDKGFGTLLANYGVPTVPSKQDPYPIDDEPYFSTGPNTRRFASKKYSNVYGFQLECHKEARYTKNGRNQTAVAFGKSVVDFLQYINVYQFNKL